MLEQGLRHSKAYMLNAVAILISWAVGRIVLSMCMFWHMYHHHADIQLVDQPGVSLPVSPCERHYLHACFAVMVLLPG